MSRQLKARHEDGANCWCAPTEVSHVCKHGTRSTLTLHKDVDGDATWESQVDRSIEAFQALHAIEFSDCTEECQE